MPTVHGVAETRTLLSDMLRVFRLRGPRGVFAFGRHHRAEAAILSWPLFERLAQTAYEFEDIAMMGELDRRRRHPAGATPLTLAKLAELLGVATDGAAAATSLYAWPTALDDLLRLGEAAELSARQTMLDALARVAQREERGTAMTFLPGQPPLEGHRRIVVSLAETTAATIVIGPGVPDRPDGVELVAVVPAGPLVTGLLDLDVTAELSAERETDTASRPA